MKNTSKGNIVIEVLVSLVVGLGVAYAALSLFAHFYSSHIIFPDIPAGYEDDPSILKIDLPDGTRISAAYFEASPGGSGYTLLYSHGNGEDLSRMAPLMGYYQRIGLNVLIYDYPGYGTSEGKPSQESVYAAAKASLDFLVTDLSTPPEKVIAYGRSLGGGPSAWLARDNNLAGLILEGTFISAYRVRIPWLPIVGDKFRNLDNIRAGETPLLVIHGTEDETVPFWHGQKLYKASKSEFKRHLWVNGGAHNDILQFSGETYWQTLINFVDDIQSQMQPVTKDTVSLP